MVMGYPSLSKIGLRDKLTERLEVAELPDGSKLEITYHVITGAREGPVLYVGAGSHGDELTSMLVAVKVAKELGPDDLKAGTLIVVPQHNPLAAMGKRRWGIVDNLDMNRVWPGDREGSISEVIAHTIFESLVKSSDYLVDLHTAMSDGENVDMAMGSPPGTFNPRDPPRQHSAREDRSREMARIFGTSFVVERKSVEAGRVKYYRFPQGQLHIAATKHGIPGIVVELGEGGRVRADKLKTGYRGVLNVAKYLGMMDGDPELPERQVVIRSFHAVRAPKGGIFIPYKRPGDPVEKGEALGCIVQLNGSEDEIRSPRSGYAVRLTRYSYIYPGERLFIIGSEEAEKSLQ